MGGVVAFRWVNNMTADRRASCRASGTSRCRAAWCPAGRSRSSPRSSATSRPASRIRSSRPKPRWRSAASTTGRSARPATGRKAKGGTTGPVATKFIPTPDLTNAELQKQRTDGYWHSYIVVGRRGDAGLRRGAVLTGGLAHRELPPHAGAEMTAFWGVAGGDRCAGLRHGVGLAAGLVDLPGQPRVLGARWPSPGRRSPA